ncbi:Maf family protein [soil metagenome]
MSLTLVLASQSPARLTTLRAAGIEPTVMVSGVDEEQLAGLAPTDLARALARLKAEAVAPQAPAQALVIGCDSVLDLDGEALGKPQTATEAAARWRAMRGRSGFLVTGHCLIDTATGVQVEATGSTRVDFAYISDAEIDAYIATEEPLWVAGSFTVDGFGGAFVTGIDGDFHNVVGLSLPLLRSMVIELGHFWPDLWNLR